MAVVLGWDCYFLCKSQNYRVAVKAHICYIAHLITTYKGIGRVDEFIAGFMESTLLHRRRKCVIHYVACKCIMIQLEKEMLKLTTMRICCGKLSNNLLRETVEPETIEMRLHKHISAILPQHTKALIGPFCHSFRWFIGSCTNKMTHIKSIQISIMKYASVNPEVGKKIFSI